MLDLIVIIYRGDDAAVGKNTFMYEVINTNKKDIQVDSVMT